MNYFSTLPMYYGASPVLFSFAKQMRIASTEAESKLWEILHTAPFKNYNFRRQHPIASYIADFYSHPLKLVIEADGGIHKKKAQKQYDAFRDEDMQQFGIIVLRFTNQQILEEIEAVTKLIKITIHKNGGGC